MTCPERALFYALKEIYSDYRQGAISKSKGEDLKNKAMRQFEIDNGAFMSAMKILRENALLWKSIEKTSSQYRLERTLENADAFLEAVYNVPIKSKTIETKEGD